MKTPISKKTLMTNFDKAYKQIAGKQFTLYCSGSKQKVWAYIKQYGIPKNADHKIARVGNEIGLYMHFKH